MAVKQYLCMNRSKRDDRWPAWVRRCHGAVSRRSSDATLIRCTQRRVWRYLAIHRLPWPEGKIQSPPGAFSTPSLGWERDRQVVVELVERFVTTPPDTLAAIHPTFGRMRPRDWDVLQYRHLDHHLRQFGV
jgi:hypothetical protein